MTSPVIAVEAVSLETSGRPLLSGLSCTVSPGETIGLVGPSGCGKSTLLRALTGFHPLRTGEAQVNGHRLTPKTGEPELLRQLRQSVGLVFQHDPLFPHLSVLENIALGPAFGQGRPRDAVYREAHDLLARVGLADKAYARPETLSGGQRQRVAILRALALRPQVLLLDEPTSALDPPMSREVWQLVQSVAAQGMTVLVVSHDWPFLCRIADRVLFLADGGLVAEGAPTTLPQTVTHPVARSFFAAVTGESA